MDTKSEELFPHIETIGYANRTGMHPVGSFIGWERPTVFSLPLVFRQDLDEVIAQYEDKIRLLRDLLRT